MVLPCTPSFPFHLEEREYNLNVQIQVDTEEVVAVEIVLPIEKTVVYNSSPQDVPPQAAPTSLANNAMPSQMYRT